MDANCTTDSEDYYRVLGCERDATADEIKKSYQRLALTLHPDKTSNEEGVEKKFLCIQTAWSVLRNPESRKQYDAELSCQEHSELLLYDTVPLNNMELTTDVNVYKYSCRCGGNYFLETSEPLPSQVVVGCDACSLSISVNI